MPKNTKMLSNEEALREGIDRALWKIELGSNYFHKTVKYDINKVAFFDHREAPTVAALLIDISSVADKPEDVKRKFYLAELKKFEQEFVLSNDPQTKHRFMERLCGALATRIDIDWNDAGQSITLYVLLKRSRRREPRQRRYLLRFSPLTILRRRCKGLKELALETLARFKSVLMR